MVLGEGVREALVSRESETPRNDLGRSEAARSRFGTGGEVVRVIV